MINSKIRQLLGKLNIPIYYQKTTTKPEKYIIFSVPLEQDSSFFDDTNLCEKYYVTVNYWYKKSEDKKLYKEIKNILKSNYFLFKDSTDLEDGDSRGKSMDFIYENEV